MSHTFSFFDGDRHSVRRSVSSRSLDARIEKVFLNKKKHILDVTTPSDAIVVSATTQTAELVDRIRLELHRYLDKPSVYKRMQKLPEYAQAIMDMFESFGQLFMNGDLGTCKLPSSVST